MRVAKVSCTRTWARESGTSIAGVVLAGLMEEASETSPIRIFVPNIALKMFARNVYSILPFIDPPFVYLPAKTGNTE
jgi:hypothetical protein